MIDNSKVKVFEVQAPDGRFVRVPALDLETLKQLLLPGYVPTGEAFGTDPSNGWNGGYVVKFGAPSPMKVYLENHGEELLDWLRSKGVIAHDGSIGMLGAKVETGGIVGSAGSPVPSEPWDGAPADSAPGGGGI